MAVDESVPMPKRSLAEILAAVQAKSNDVATVQDSGTVKSAPVRRMKRAVNGTRRYKNVMIKLEPAMIASLDKIGEEMRLSRSELLRQAAQRVWLEQVHK